MLLDGKIAVVHGAGGSVGSAVAHAFAREGATVYLAGRTLAPLEAIAQQITADGGVVDTAVVDALNEAEVLRHTEAIVTRAGRLDVCFNAIAVDHIQGVPLAELTVEEVVAPVAARVATHLITARVAARYMRPQGGGTILTFSADAARLAYPEVGSFGVACAAVEALTRSLAAELGRHGIRVVCLRSMGSPEAPNVAKVWELRSKGVTGSREEVINSRAGLTLLGRLPSLAEVGNVAALMASDYASPLTANVINVTCGEIAD